MKEYNIGINVNLSKDPEEMVLNRIQNSIKEILPEANIMIFRNSKGLTKDVSQKLNLLLALGGDGTILNTARSIYGSEVSIFGVNIGNLGFLSSCDLKNFNYYFKKWVLGDFIINQRMMLKCSINGKQGNFALNDVVIARETLSRILKYKIFIDDKFYTSYTADGIIVSTPTGSTAYSFSAGGPIIYPDLDNICITPICPHTQLLRSIVLDSNKKITIKFEKLEQNIFLSIDGQNFIKLQESDEVIISKSQEKINLINFKEIDYFTILRTKLINKTRECAGENDEV